MSEKKMKKDADEKSDETSDERLATATESFTRFFFSSRAFRSTVVYRDDRRKTYE